jgi:hypothetical protein
MGAMRIWARSDHGEDGHKLYQNCPIGLVFNLYPGLVNEKKEESQGQTYHNLILLATRCFMNIYINQPYRLRSRGVQERYQS